MIKNIPGFMAIRETAKTGIMSEHSLRRREKQGALPGRYSGQQRIEGA